MHILLTLIRFISEMCSWFFWFDVVFPMVVLVLMHVEEAEGYAVFKGRTLSQFLLSRLYKKYWIFWQFEGATTVIGKKSLLRMTPFISHVFPSLASSE